MLANNKLLILLIFLFSPLAYSDVVKPTLVEIIADTKGEIRIEIRASIEALLTGINGQYKNTKDSPNANAYNKLRVLPPAQLQTSFANFTPIFLDKLNLKVDQVPTKLRVTKIVIPEVGYPKVPRIAVIHLQANISPNAQNLQWFYPEKFSDNAVRVKQVNQAQEKWHWSQWQWLRHNQPSSVFSLTALFKPEPLWKTISNYIGLGITHIIPKGLDHILFIFGLFLFSTMLRPLLAQVTMFTVAHTMTLGLAMNGIISLPANIVEPLIALSIAYIAIENIFNNKLHRYRLALVFGFGLLHGLGFASVLADFGMPESAFVTALISFNVGVEIGQLIIITLAFLALGIWFRNKPWYHQRIVVPFSICIAITAIYWTLDRALLL